MKVLILEIRCEGGCEQKRTPHKNGKLIEAFPIEAEEWEIRTSQTCREGHRLLYATEPVR